MGLANFNPHVLGIVMKEAVRRAIMEIRRQRFIFEAKAKTGQSGLLDDMVTTADNEAQKIYIKMLTECFPNYGIVAEEQSLKMECKLPGTNIYFTVDPLDGTKAFVRKQSHGIGTMIALVSESEVIAAYVGDVMTQEIFGFRPESPRVHRISEFDHSEKMAIRPKFKLSKQYVLLWRDPSRHNTLTRELIAPKENDGLFHGVEVTGGSIGIGMARLWKGEVGATILTPHHNTPWDLSPVVGISKQLGFVFLKVQDRKLVQFEPVICKETYRTENDMLVVHQTRIEELNAFAKQKGIEYV